MIGPLSAFLSSCTWAFGSTRYAQLSVQYSPFAVNATRGLIALPLFIIAALLEWAFNGFPSVIITASHIGWFFVSMISSYGLGDVFFLWSTRGLGVPGALAIASCYPLFATLGGVILQGVTPTFGQIIGLIITVAGIVLVIVSRHNGNLDASRKESDGHAQSKSNVVLSTFFAVLTSLFWGLNSYSLFHIGSEVSPFTGNVIRMTFAIVIANGVRLILSPKAPAFLPVHQVKQDCKLIGMEAFGGSMFFAYGLAHSPLVAGVTLTGLAPLIAVLIAWVKKTEPMSLHKAIGVMLSVIGVLLLIV